MLRWIMHIDLDAFFASIEQRDHPEWQGRPLVVGAAPSQRGVVATCSYEARRYGVRSAMPISQASQRLPDDAVYVRPRMAHYAAVSKQIMAALETISPVVEQASVDEAYLDVSGLERLIGPPGTIGRQAKRLIKHTVGLTASVGIGPNRLIAKLASEYRKPDGLMAVHPNEVQAFLDPMPISALRGIGPRTAPTLRQMGLERMVDIRQADPALLEKRLGLRLARAIISQAYGRGSDQVQPHSVRQSISKATTFEQDIVDPVRLRETLLWAAQEVGRPARREGLQGTTITLKIRLGNFKTLTRQRKLPAPTADDTVFYRQAWALYQESALAGKPVRLLGLGLSGWQHNAPSQGDLFDERPGPPEHVQTPRRVRLFQALDGISNKFGQNAITLGLRRKR
ncbi:DNA polymerase IV [Acidihalobacter ferrooxydans]|uniref:DNA polymerase IV n=1 Tax=Acidihalobacter ferrooxydans TaxID=1765967 RepID=A0A1P8UFK2_9GAMM|nr:DNA polymerase IV [Acidihalobacter ferrooxydans]APZ42623.1 DNA polymerase IV [Acidihalobacter ferrooxydans]